VIRIVALWCLLFTACGQGAGTVDAQRTVDTPALFCGGDPCNLLIQTGCCTGHKCTFVSDSFSEPYGHIDCPPIGTVAIGGHCRYTSTLSRYDDCVQGAFCHDGICKQICGLDGTVPCPRRSHCQAYDYLFGPPGSMAAGVCDPEFGVTAICATPP